MTDLENMQRAKMYMDKLAQGIDPISNREIPADSTLNNIHLARCFFYLSGLLGEIISSKETGSKNKKVVFTVAPEQLSQIRIQSNMVTVTQFVDMLNNAVQNPGMKKLQTTVITDWLLEKGFLEMQIGPDGKNRRVPTKYGLQIGISIEIREGRTGPYSVVYYNAQAQQFLLDNLGAMLIEKSVRRN